MLNIFNRTKVIIKKFTLVRTLLIGNLIHNRKNIEIQISFGICKNTGIRTCVTLLTYLIE